MHMYMQVSTQNLDSIKTRFEWDANNIEPLVKTCMTTLSSKV